MARSAESSTFALDETLWFGDGDDAEAESRAAASLAAVGTRIVGAKPFPVAARRLDELTRNPTTRIEQVVTVLESDPALSARLLRLVNSAGYGLKVRCTSVRHAAVLVGTRRLNQVATTAAILDLFDGSNGLGMELLEHAAVVGSLCRYLAVHLGLPHDELFTCGFLHDIGKLMLLDSERERYAELLAEFGSAPDQMHLAERRMFGFDHAVLGAHVLAAWNIPEPVPRVIAWHHSPARAMQDTVLAAMVETLRLADLLAYVVAMPDTRQAIEITANSEAARYLEISDVQLAAMWEDLVGLRERSRARTNGEPELDVMVPKLEMPESLAPRSSKGPSSRAPNSRMSAPNSLRAGTAKPLQEVPTHFPCHVCGKPSYAHVCAVCGGQVCPEHQASVDEWCTSCAREFARFKKTERLSTAVRVAAGLLVGTTLSIAVVSAVRVPNSGVESWIAAPLLVLALWAVVLPVAYKLWRKLTFLDRRRGVAQTQLSALPVARQQLAPQDSMAPREAQPGSGPPSGEQRAAQALDSQPDSAPYSSEPSLSVGPLSLSPGTLAAFNGAPSSASHRSVAPASPPPSSGRQRVPYSLTPNALQSSPATTPSITPERMQMVSPKISVLHQPADSLPAPMPEVSLLPNEYQTVPPRVLVAPEAAASLTPPSPAVSLSPRISIASELATPSLLDALAGGEQPASPVMPAVRPAPVVASPNGAPTGRRSRKPRRSNKRNAARVEPVANQEPPSEVPSAQSAELLPASAAEPARVPDTKPAEPSAPVASAPAAPVPANDELQTLNSESDETGPSSRSGAHLVLRPPAEPPVNSPVKMSFTVGCAARSLRACAGNSGPVSSYGPTATPGSRESA